MRIDRVGHVRARRGSGGGSSRDRLSGGGRDMGRQRERPRELCGGACARDRTGDAWSPGLSVHAGRRWRRCRLRIRRASITCSPVGGACRRTEWVRSVPQLHGAQARPSQRRFPLPLRVGRRPRASWDGGDAGRSCRRGTEWSGRSASAGRHGGGARTRASVQAPRGVGAVGEHHQRGGAEAGARRDLAELASGLRRACRSPTRVGAVRPSHAARVPRPVRRWGSASARGAAAGS